MINKLTQTAALLATLAAFGSSAHAAAPAWVASVVKVRSMANGTLWVTLDDSSACNGVFNLASSANTQSVRDVALAARLSGRKVKLAANDTTTCTIQWIELY